MVNFPNTEITARIGKKKKDNLIEKKKATAGSRQEIQMSFKHWKRYPPYS